MNLKVRIKGVKCIKDYTFELPLEKGIYAITGKNGTGKSTLAACASSSFYRFPSKPYLGTTDENALIECVLEGKTISYKRKENSDEWYRSKNEHLPITGFFEGSILYGNRFRDLRYENIFRIENINKDRLTEVSNFIRENLGLILHNNKSFYENVYVYKDENLEKWKTRQFKGKVFYYSRLGSFVNQFQMSTGEYLLVHLLYTLEYLLNLPRKEYFVVFLDEVELALHPSALKQLLHILSDIAEKSNIAIYFSTHSIELISEIKPGNILYIERFHDDSLKVNTPCYPAYATRTLYDFNGYDYVILVEDELAKGIIEELLKKNGLRSNKLIYVLPSGGWSQVLDLFEDSVSNNLLGHNTNIYAILDGDIKDVAYAYLDNKGSKINRNRLAFLPIESVEKYLHKELIVSVNHELYSVLDSNLFDQVGLQSIIDNYLQWRDNEIPKRKEKFPEATNEEIISHIDPDGKTLYKYLEQALHSRRKDKDDLIRLILEYLFASDHKKLEDLTAYLIHQFK